MSGVKAYKFEVDRKPGFMQRQKKTLTGRVEGQLCPSCATMLDGFTCVTAEAMPQAGDFTVCFYCANVLRWSEGMKLEKSALIEVPVEVRLSFVKLVEAIRAKEHWHD